MRQWVLSVPKRLRYFMQRDGAVLSMVLRIFLRVLDDGLAQGGFTAKLAQPQTAVQQAING